MRKNWLFTLLLISLLLPLFSCGSTEGEFTRPDEKAFKGMELYSWQDEQGEWRFSILVGTNRIKSREEVLSNPMDIHGVKQSFCTMAVDEQVFLTNERLGLASVGTPDLLIPPQDIVDELIDHATDCDIDLIVTPEMSN
jgi:hypothetical protein